MRTTPPAMFAALALTALGSSLPMAAMSAGEPQNAEYPSAVQAVSPPMVTLQLHDEAANASAAGTPAVLLYAGQVQVLDLPNVSRIAVGNGGVLKAQVIESGQVVLIGQSAGTTTMRVWTRAGNQQAYEVTVRANEAVRAARDIQDMLAAEPGLKVNQYDGHVLIEGDYKDPATSRKLEAIAKMYPQIVVSMVPDHKIQMPVPLEKMVYLDVRLVEVRKNALEQLGIQWNSPVTGPHFKLGGNVVPHAAGSWTTAFGIATDLTSMLNILENNGDSWTLAEPRVSCKSGGDAKFVVGGEIPIPVVSGLGQTSVIYKQYGVILEFHPVADDQGNVSSKIVAEVSQPDQQFTNQGFIAFRQNRTETQVSLRENETLVISGLLQNAGSKAVTGIPGISELPILGALFRSKEFQNERTELIVMVTPRAATPQSETSVTMAKRSDEKFSAVKSVIATKMAE